MKYIYNPIEIDDKGRTLGSAIAGFVYNSIKYDHPVGKIIQYEDPAGEELLNTFGFLQNLTRSDVDKVLENQKKKLFPCEYCNKSFDAKIALTSHMRTHANEIKDKEQPLDPSIVPVAQGTVLNSFAQNSAEASDETSSSDFYGPGFQEQR